MRTGQRDMHNTPLKRRLSITYEELETLKKSIKVSVLNELRTEMEDVSDQDSIKDLVLSEIRTELMGIPNPALLKASILNELRTELKTSEGNDSEKTERKLKELAGIQDGLVRELLDQKTLIKKLGTQIENLTKELDDTKKYQTVPVAPPSAVPSSITLDIPEDPLDLPPISRKLYQKNELQNEKPSYRLGEFREAPASLPGTGSKVKLKFKEIEPAELDREEVSTKCEYIIAENRDNRWPKGTVRQQPSVKQPSIKELARQRTSIKMERQQPQGKLFPQKQPPVNKEKPAEIQHVDKCEYIIADRISKKYLIEESVDVRENEDAEVITCSRKSSRAQ